ncbi:condensation domain-containing protein [Micromonospora inaquosa]|uniref:Condensation domain-containing protein n=1 Tax=Micromonospora inaquosa TaxID=2203716 RepID=A0A3N9WY56_9ACTN|nr:condensation domain-containing protein [Micromonospora inaquosa]RQX05620.1 hypothetical protein DLJ59_07170 [Micromonospora inaquosa]
MDKAPLTWAQKMHWYLYHSTLPGGRWRNNVLTYWAVPAGVGVSDCVEALHRLVQEHQALRARYPADVVTGPVQVVEPDFRPPVALCDVSGAADERSAVEAFVGQVLRQEFDLAAAPPVSAVLVTDGEQVRWLALVVHHISTDGASRQVLAASFGRHLAAVRRGVPAPLPRLGGPLSDAALQQSAAGLRQSAASLRRWTTVAAAMPATTLPVEPASVAGPLPTEALLATPGAAACERVAKRSGVPVSAVFLGAYAAIVGRFLGMARVPVNVYSSNRFSPEKVNVVGCLYQTLPLVVEQKGGERLRDFLQRAQGGLLDSYRFGHHDYDTFTDTRVRQQFSWGRNVSVMPSFNFSPVGAAGDTSGAIVPTDWSVRAIEHDLGDPFELVVQVVGADVRYAVRFDAALIESGTATALVSAMHRFLTIAAEHPDSSVDELLDLADVPVSERDAGWIERDGSWVHRDGIVAAARRHPAVSDAAVLVEPSGALTLHVTAAAGLTAHGLRCHLTELLTELPGTVVPDAFVLRPAPPTDGREPDDRTPETLRWAVFESALRRARPGSSWTASSPYLPQGGRTADLWRVLAELTAEGLVGLTYTDFLGFRPLGDLAEAVVALHSGDPVVVHAG